MNDPWIEASSLSAITELAFNPPADVNAHYKAPLDALTLYIARVPGRHDVFLTTMKPRDRVVSAQDVHSSMYYVHVNDLEDLTLLEHRRPTSADIDASQLLLRPQHTIKRKPLIPPRSPKRMSPPRENPPQNAQQVASDPARETHKIVRKPVVPVRNTVARTAVPEPSGLKIPRPLPPIPIETPLNGSLHDSNIHLLRSSEHTEETNPYLMSCEPGISDCVPPPGTLTLIRRDPGTGDQWNVAHVQDSCLRDLESPTSCRSSSISGRKPDAIPVLLELTNPGYDQFLDVGACDSGSSLSSHSGKAPLGGNFRRSLQTSRSWDAAGEAEPSSPSGLLTYDGSSPFVKPKRLSRIPRKAGYTFSSPWAGICEFATGATGKSLKCKHSVAGSVADVSELRFNLPTVMNRNHEREVKRSSRLLHRRQLSEQDDDVPTILVDESGEIDLSLGQEFAGGGFGGRQAKLGKLIVYPEGLKMLDLVVAANMGLWWRAYRKT